MSQNNLSLLMRLPAIVPQQSGGMHGLQLGLVLDDMITLFEESGESFS